MHSEITLRKAYFNFYHTLPVAIRIDRRLLTTRPLRFLEPYRGRTEAILTLFKPVEEDSLWKVAFSLTTPSKWERSISFDYLPITVVHVLVLVRAYLQGMEYLSLLDWQGRVDCGLPDHVAKPPGWVPPDIPAPEENPGDLEVFSTTTLTYPGASDSDPGLDVTLFMPRPVDGGRWKCGAALGARESAPVYYGFGDDFIDAFLDAASIARLIYDSMAPKGWTTKDLTGCENWPYKVGRAFYVE